jgi:hypothetical protein
VLDRTRADVGVKPQPREGTRKTALSATGVSNGTFDFEDLLRAERDCVFGADVVMYDVVLEAARLTWELCDDADPASISAT